MFRKIENSNINRLCQLLRNINSGINSMINDYGFLFEKKETKLFNNIMQIINSQIMKISNNDVNYEEIYEILDYENDLKPFVFRCWEYEYGNGNEYISWFKRDKIGEMPKVISTTFGNADSFCDSRYGISYKITIDSFLGACNKDAATVIEENNRQSLYTIGITDDGSAINSYNLATPIITPKQVFDKSLNTYLSKHNEIILDSRYIKPIKVIYTDDRDLDMVNAISSKYGIPIEFKKNGYTK